MGLLPWVMAAGGLFSLTLGVPTTHSHDHTHNHKAHQHLHHRHAHNVQTLDRRSSDVYVVYAGDGTVSQGWPSMSDWVSDYDTMFAANKPLMKTSCSNFDVADDSDDEIQDIYDGIQTVAGETGLDERFILAIMMQESGGCVRAPTTNGGVRNPGLMQDHNGEATCNEDTVVNPCPNATIVQMLRDGAAGTSSGDGLKQTVAQSGATDVSKYYKGARIYNSGSIASSGNLGQGVATHCYASDIANRLTGWVYASSTCDEDTIGSLSGSTNAATTSTASRTSSSSSHLSTSSSRAATSSTTLHTSTSSRSTSSSSTTKKTTSTSSSSSTKKTSTTSSTTKKTTTTSSSTKASSTSSSTKKTTSTSTKPTSTTSSSTKKTTSTSTKATSTTSSSTKKTTSTSTKATSTSSSSTKKTTSTSTKATSTTASAASRPTDAFPGATTSCKKWYHVNSGDYCWLMTNQYGITLTQLMNWNTGLNEWCSNLWAGYSYCVSA